MKGKEWRRGKIGMKKNVWDIEEKSRGRKIVISQERIKGTRE